MTVPVTVAVEGEIDEAVALRLLNVVGLDHGPSHVAHGQGKLLKHLGGYNSAAARSPWFVLTDLDGGQSGRCVPHFLAQHLPDPAEQMLLRVAVQQIEAWLIADAEALAGFLSVEPARVPRSPEDAMNAKESMVNLARVSSERTIREGMVPRPRSGRSVGPEYAGLVGEFALYVWDPVRASDRSPSLRRALARLRELAARL